CPSCNDFTDVMPNQESMSREEAKIKAAYYRFDRYVERETDEQRKAREARNPLKDEHKTLTHKRFDLLIWSAGYTEEERQHIEALEAELPAAHIKKSESN